MVIRTLITEGFLRAIKLRRWAFHSGKNEGVEYAILNDVKLDCVE